MKWRDAEGSSPSQTIFYRAIRVPATKYREKLYPQVFFILYKKTTKIIITTKVVREECELISNKCTGGLQTPVRRQFTVGGRQDAGSIPAVSFLSVHYRKSISQKNFPIESDREIFFNKYYHSSCISSCGDRIFSGTSGSGRL